MVLNDIQKTEEQAAIWFSIEFSASILDEEKMMLY